MKVSILMISMKTRINNLNLNFSWGCQYSLDNNILAEYLNPYPLSWLPRTNFPHDEIPRFHDVASTKPVTKYKATFLQACIANIKYSHDLVWPMKISGVKFDFWGNWRKNHSLFLSGSVGIRALKFSSPELTERNFSKTLNEK